MKKWFVLTTLLFVSTICQSQIPIYLDENQPMEKRIQDALERMTLQEKVALTRAQSKFTSPGVPRLGIPEIAMSDGPHGVRAELQWDSFDHAGWTNDSCTAFPALTCLAATWNPGLAAKYGKAIGQEARYRNKNVLLGPGVNIYRIPLNGRNFEYMGEDPYLAAEMCVPYIQELQKNGVAACVKHFALNNQERWRDEVDVEVSDRALHEIYLPAFKAAVLRGGAWSIMGAYNKYRGEHCCHNTRLLQEILKGDWAFDGCVISDWGGTHDTREAALNGLDIEMGTFTNATHPGEPFHYADAYLGNKYLEMLLEGTIPQSGLDEKVSRILRLIFRTGMNRNRPYGSFCTEEHYATAREIGTEGIVLMRNEKIKGGNRLLPIDDTKYLKILLVGANASRSLTTGGGSSELKPQREITPLQAFKEKYGDKIDYAEGYTFGPYNWNGEDPVPSGKLKTLREEAVEKAKQAGLVIFIGGLNKNSTQDSEGADRLSYSLPYEQDELITSLAAVNPNLITVLISGNAVAMPWINQVPALIQSWYLGSEAGHSLTDVMSGAVCPSGKLPFSFPLKLEDNGAYAHGEESYPGVEYQQTYKEDILVGYRWHDTRQIPALFSFGHGLSYTTFHYGKAKVVSQSDPSGRSFLVSIPIRNTGQLPGKETVQLYVGAENSTVFRAAKELKAFQKVALTPGEEQIIHFSLTEEAFSYYDEAIQSWKTETGRYKLYIGGSSTDIRETASIQWN